MKINSIRFKTNVIYTFILGFILILFGFILFFEVKIVLYQDVDDKLRIKANEIAQIIHAYEKLKQVGNHPLSILESLLSQENRLVQNKMIIDDIWRADVETLNLKKDYIHIFDEKGKIVLNSANIDQPFSEGLHQQFPQNVNKIYYRNISYKGAALRTINYPFLFRDQLPFIIQIATPLKSEDMLLQKLFVFIIGSIFLILVITSFVGGIFVKNILEPVMSVIKTANNVSHEDLSVRIPSKEADIEMKALIESFNTMIARLENSFNHISEFSSHVAHELKTPLAIIRGEMELALDQDREREEYKETMRDCLEEIDRMIKIIKDLLLISKFDYHPEIFHFEKIDVNSLLEDIIEHAQILAMPKKIAVEYVGEHEKLFIPADKVHLRRLFLNIVNNAIKYTLDEGKVILSVKKNSDSIQVIIKDSGIGIPEQHIDKIFDKFYRAHKEQDSGEYGSGLGLSMAMSIARAHKGQITVSSIPQQGSEFTVSLPLS